MDTVVEPTLHRTATTFLTTDTDLAASLYADSLLELVSWDLNSSGDAVVFTFNDPQGVGPRLQREFFGSPSHKLLSVKKYLALKVRDVLRPRSR